MNEASFPLQRLKNVSENIFSIAVIACVLLMSLAPKMIVPAVLICILCLLISEVRHLQVRDLIAKSLVLIIVAFVISLSFYVLFETNIRSTKESLKTLLICVPFLVTYNLFIKTRYQFPNWLCIALPYIYFFSLILCLHQLSTNTSIKFLLGLSAENATERDFNDFVLSNVLFFWFVLAVHVRFSIRRLSWLTLLNMLLLLYIVIISSSETAKLCLIASSLIFFVSILIKQKTKLLIQTLILLSLLLISFIPTKLINQGLESSVINNIQVSLGDSALHRIDIWDHNLNLIKQKPLVGWGTSLGKELPGADTESFYSALVKRNDFSHTHNVFIQAAVCMGVLGTVLILFFLQLHLKKIEQATSVLQPYAYAAFTSWLCAWLVGISLWRSWCLVFLAFYMLCFALLLTKQNQADN